HPGIAHRGVLRPAVDASGKRDADVIAPGNSAADGGCADCTHSSRGCAAADPERSVRREAPDLRATRLLDHLRLAHLSLGWIVRCRNLVPARRPPMPSKSRREAVDDLTGTGVGR